LGTYRVVGPHKVFGNAPGEEFTKKLPAEQEKNLIVAGHIEKKKRNAKRR
jgi:hypothetical protein